MNGGQIGPIANRLLRRAIHKALSLFSHSLRLGFILYVLLAMTFGDSWQAWFLPDLHALSAHASYGGKYLRTVEYSLGGGAGVSQFQAGTDNPAAARASDTNVYAGTSWNPTKASAGLKTITLNGTGIRVVSAYVDSSAFLTTGTDVTDVEVALDVKPGMRPGEDVELTPISRNSTNNRYLASTGLTKTMALKSNATPLFQSITDTEWGNGVSVVGMISITGPTFTNETMKLVITYEEDYISSTPHNATKTIRFPLRSTATGDSGTMQTPCTSNSTCGFTYYANLPDLATTSDIYDVWFEVSYENDGSTGASSTLSISGGTGAASIPQIEVTADNTEHLILYRPLIGTPNFMATTTQTLNILSGLSSKYVLGGELVVTYKFSTGKAVQAETVRYFLNQDLAAPGTASTSLSKAVSISNTGATVQNLWFKTYASATGTMEINYQGKIGSSASTSANYSTTMANQRTGELQIIHDMGTATSSFSSATTTVQATLKQSSASSDAPLATEVYVTFTWSGSGGGVETKTNRFFAGNSGLVPASTNEMQAFPYDVELPETVTKTYRSAYVRETTIHSNNNATITTGTRTFLPVASSSISIVDSGGTENFMATYLVEATTTDGFTASSTISWTKRSFLNVSMLNQNNQFAVSGEMTVTYDAALGQDAPTATAKHLRTVEFVLGGGAGTAAGQTGLDMKQSDLAGAESSDANVYAGTSWSTTKGSAGTKTIAIPGTGIRVVSAYLESTAKLSNGNDTTDVEVDLDVRPGMAPNTDVKLSPLGRDGTSLVFIKVPGATTFGNPAFKYLTDATPLFQNQTDTEWNNGLSVVGMLSITGPTWSLATMKLVITYEQDYSATPHTELKTVRYPLLSTATGDSGGISNYCIPGGAPCAFNYNATLTDLATTSDISDVWFDITYLNDTTAYGTTTLSGGSMGVLEDAKSFPTIYANNLEHIIYRPAIGTPNFMATTSQQLTLAPQGNAYHSVSIELVVTYKYSTGAPTQVETVRYLLGQSTNLPNANSTSSLSRTITISNSGFSPQRVWIRHYTHSRSGASGLGWPTNTFDATIGTSASTTVKYFNAVFTRDNPHSGDIETLVDLGSATTSWSGASAIIRTSMGADFIGSAPFGAEVFVTFTWNAGVGGTQTQTATFFAGASGSVPATANATQAFPYNIELPETVTKTYRSAYVKEIALHTQTSPITLATTTFFAAASSSVAVPEVGVAAKDATNTITHYFAEATTSDYFSSGTTIPWTKRSFLNVASLSAADFFVVSGEAVMTYDAAFPTLNPALTLLHFLWRSDNASESLASPLAAQDVSLTNLYVGDRYRLRFLIDNQGNGSASSIAYRLEHASSSCTAWMAVPSDTGVTTEHWKMDLSQYVTDGTASTDNANITDPSHSFVAGQVRTSANQSSAQTLTNTQFTEQEYSIRSTQNVTLGTTYCFRLTNAGDTTNFTYSIQPQATLSFSLHPTGGGVGVDLLGTGSAHASTGEGGGTTTDGTGSGSTHNGGTRPGGNNTP